MRARQCWAVALLLALVTLVPGSSARAALPRATIYVTRLDPVDRAARDFARSGYGGGIDVSWPVNGTEGMVAVMGGIEAIRLLSKVKTFPDQTTLLPTGQEQEPFASQAV